MEYDIILKQIFLLLGPKLGVFPAGGELSSKNKTFELLNIES